MNKSVLAATLSAKMKESEVYNLITQNSDGIDLSLWGQYIYFLAVKSECSIEYCTKFYGVAEIIAAEANPEYTLGDVLAILVSGEIYDRLKYFTSIIFEATIQVELQSKDTEFEVLKERMLAVIPCHADQLSINGQLLIAALNGIALNRYFATSNTAMSTLHQLDIATKRSRIV